MMPIILFGGFYSNAGNYLVWIDWVQYASVIRYAFEGLIHNEYDNRQYSAN